MLRFVLQRFAMVLLTLFAVSVLVFVVTEVLPGDVATMILGQYATPESLAVLRAQLDLDQPALVRYLSWLQGMLMGDWGESLYLNVPVRPLVLQRFSNTVLIAGLTLLIGVPLGILLGIIAGLTRDRWPDQLVTVGTLLTLSLPGFVLASFLIMLFSSWLGLLPSSSMIEPDISPLEAARFLVLPTLTLVMALLAHIARQTRSSIIEVMESQYIRTAILKGLPLHTVVWRHALKNAMLPTISVIALNVGFLMSGAIIVENVFAYPGLGRLLLLAASNQDIPLLQASVLIVTLIFGLANLAADLLYYYLNPRIRYG
ncbi:ABC transporter permease [Candidatus Chloroploca sp. Khr17]|uniref:ABC transporter permease n=1 Tax=Candidatus Chloroploca sp. Khr17 TaxID=2496869 RepID=UPI00101C0672|nr:ABC transporter permease [Candidatus Chloroploca sp. Khr17]